MLKKFLSYNFLIFLASSISAQMENQRDFSITFSPNFEVDASDIEFSSNQEVEIDMFKFYVGYFSLENETQILWVDSTYHLIDFQNKTPIMIKLSIPEDTDIDELSFNIGVDSITNISGAFEGDLDPINGMYWAWNTGYINSKIEGSIVDNDNAKTEFKFHLGGYQSPFQSTRSITIPVKKSDHIFIEVDLPEFLKKANLEDDVIVMSPSKRAALLSTYFSQSFRLNEE